MKIVKYGVVLSRLTEQDIEMVRKWRNDPLVSQYMEFRDTITPEMQANWFRSLDPDHDFFFILEKNGNSLGLLNLKNVDFVKKTGEAGVFLASVNQRLSMLAYQSVLALGDFAFEDLGLETLNAHILRDNKRAIRFNTALGFKLLPGQEDNENQLYSVSRADYMAHSERLKQSLLRKAK